MAKNGKGWFGVEFNGSHVSELMVTRDLEVLTEEGRMGEEITIIKKKKKKTLKKKTIYLYL